MDQGGPRDSTPSARRPRPRGALVDGVVSASGSLSWALLWASSGASQRRRASFVAAPHLSTSGVSTPPPQLSESCRRFEIASSGTQSVRLSLHRPDPPRRRAARSSSRVFSSFLSSRPRTHCQSISRQEGKLREAPMPTFVSDARYPRAYP